MPFLIVSRQFQICLGSCLSLLYNAVQQHQPLMLVHVEKYPCDTVTRKICADLMQTIAHWAADGHSNGPSEFNGSNILSNEPPIFGWHFL